MDAVVAPPDEEQRLDALRRLEVLDTAPEPDYDHVVELVANLLDAPIALISLVDRDRQWFKARIGLPVTETSRDVSFCAHAIMQDDDGPFVVIDAQSDPRFADNPLVTGDPGIRFYAGQALHAPGGERVGTLCVIDRVPRTLDDQGRELLARFALLIERMLERRVPDTTALQRSESREALVLATMHDGLVHQDADGRIVQWNAAAERVLGLSGDELRGTTSLDPHWRAVHADGSPWPGDTHPAMQAIRTGENVRDAIMGVYHPDQQLVWLRVNSTPITELDGTVSGALTSFADITALVRAEQSATNTKPGADNTLARAAREVFVEPRLEQFLATIRDTIDSLEREHAVVAHVLDELRDGHDLRAIVEHAGTTIERDHMTAALSRLEEARRLTRVEMFRALTREGCSLGEIARMWGVSRQLVSRILRDADLVPRDLQQPQRDEDPAHGAEEPPS